MSAQVTRGASTGGGGEWGYDAIRTKYASGSNQYILADRYSIHPENAHWRGSEIQDQLRGAPINHIDESCIYLYPRWLYLVLFIWRNLVKIELTRYYITINL